MTQPEYKYYGWPRKMSVKKNKAANVWMHQCHFTENVAD